MKNRIIAYFSISKTEYNGLFILLLVILSGVLLSEVYRYMSAKPLPPVQYFADSMADKPKKQPSKSKEQSYKNTIKSAHFYDFDPNTADISTWTDFGLSLKQAQSILKYLQKGGKFRKNEDLRKMVVISEQLYQQLLPYIHIIDVAPTYSYDSKSNFAAKDKGGAYVMIELNTADTTQLKKLRGIGSAFAARIVKYRNRLGGFYDVSQLKDVHGVNDSLYQAIKSQLRVDISHVQKIAINTAQFADLKRFKFLSNKQINALLAYRDEHGKFLSIEDLKKIVALPLESIQKISPYIQYD